MLKYLGNKHRIEVENAAVVTTRGIQHHLSRPGKSAARLTETDLDRFPEIIARPKAVLYDLHDEEKSTLLYVFDPAAAKAKHRLGKVVVRVNFNTPMEFGKEKRTRITANVVRTAGYVKTHNLEDDRYELIEGVLK